MGMPNEQQKCYTSSPGIGQAVMLPQALEKEARRP